MSRPHLILRLDKAPRSLLGWRERGKKRRKRGPEARQRRALRRKYRELHTELVQIKPKHTKRVRKKGAPSFREWARGRP